MEQPWSMTITQARALLLDMPKRLARGKSMTVTRRGKPVLAIIPWDLYEGLVETLEIMGDSQLMTELRQSIEQIKTGKTVPWEKVKRDLRL